MKRIYLLFAVFLLFLQQTLFPVESSTNAAVENPVLDEKYFTDLLFNDLENHYLYFRRGIVRLESRLFNEAIADFNTAIRMKSDESAYYFFRAYARYLQGKHNEAIIDYTEAVSLDNTNHQYYFYRGLANVKLNEFDDAIADFNEAINFCSDNPMYYFERGYTKRLQERYREAVDDYTEAIFLDETNCDLYFYRGFARDQLRDANGALDDYSRAIQLGTQISNAYYNRGVIYKSRKEYNKAIEDYNQAINLAINSPDDLSKYYNSRGNAYSDWGNIDQAMNDYLYAIELNPNNSNPYYNIGLLYKNNLELYDEAIQYFSYAIELGTNNEYTFLNRGLTYEILGEYQKALEDLNVTLEINRNHYTALKNRARVKAKMGDFYGAGVDYWQDEQNVKARLSKYPRESSSNTNDVNQNMKDYFSEIVSDRSNPDPYHSLGMLYKNEFALYDEAIKYFTYAVDLGSENQQLFLNRGLTYEILGEYQKALEDLNKTLEINENHYTALECRARIKAKMGDFYGAGVDYWQDEQNWDRRLREQRTTSN